MFCTNCGVQNPDTASFCEQCGSPLTKPTEQAQPVTPVEQAQQPMQPTMPAASPVDLQKPGQGIPVQPAAQPVYQQPQQFQQPGAMQQPGGMQPAYAAPVYTQTGAPKKSKTVPIVIASVSAVVVAFLIILFVVIIPNSGIRGKLRHRWTVTEGGSTVTYDFKKNTLSAGIASSNLDIPINWSVQGDDHLTIEVSMFGIVSETSEYIFEISEDGRTLTLRDVDYPSSSLVLTRVG